MAKKLMIIGMVLLWVIGFTFAAEPVLKYPNHFGKVTASDPVLNRARAYMSKGELQFSSQNYGGFIQWSSGGLPAGYYKGYQYISDASFILGAPGRKPDGKPYPWAVRPIFNTDENRFIPGQKVYWGPTVTESWFDRTSDSKQIDWESVEGARGKLHSGDALAGEYYGGLYTDTGDPFPLLATSDIPLTWPILLNPETGLDERTWPGDWAVVTDTSATTYLQEIPGTFIGDQDVYMEFDDRLATRDEDKTQGYPLGIRVRVNAHSYGRSYAEDVAFFTVEIINESWKGFPVDTSGDGEINVKLVPHMVSSDSAFYSVESRVYPGSPGDDGFDYTNLYGGFYFDVDSYSLRGLGSDFSGRSNDDDMMAFDTINDMAFIWDWDDNSNGTHNLAYSALKLLDTPKAPWDVDINGDNITDIPAGSPLGLTDWHWFDWYRRPGVMKAETSGGSCGDDYAGDPGCPGADDKEAIMYALMAGDTSYLRQPFLGWEWRNIEDGTTNPLANYYNSWYFHSDGAGTLNPHFDSLEGLSQEFPNGLDCVFIMSAGPFNLAAGDTAKFSFAVVMGDPPANTRTLDTPPDLHKNAKMAQLMYDLHYQGFSPPEAPTVSAIPEDGRVTLYWDSKAEKSRDIVTGIEDFEGYKVYKSTDGGITWGNPATDRIYDYTQSAVGWKPIAQFDLTQKEDEDKYGKSYAGPDTVAPWFDLGTNSGLEHRYVDNDVINGVSYTYAVVAYDIGIDSNDVYTSDNHKWKFMLESLENFKGTSELLPQVVRAVPDARPSNAPQNWRVSANGGNIGTGSFFALPVNQPLVQSDADQYKIVIDARPRYKGVADAPNENNPLNTLEPVYLVINTTTGDTVAGQEYIWIEDPKSPGDSIWALNETSGREPSLMEYSSYLGPQWSGFKLFSENIEVTTLDTIEWVNKPLAIAPNYRFEISDVLGGAFALASDYEIRWGEQDTVNANQVLPFKIYNTRFETKVDIFVSSSGGDPENIANSNFPRFYSGRTYQFREYYVPGVDTPRVSTKTTWKLVISWPPSGSINVRHYENGDITQINMLKPFHKGDEFYFDATSISEMAKVTERNLQDIRVVPNPYIVTAGWETDINHKSIHFTHLPDECTIKIFTLNGELVYTLLHKDIFSGQAEWNLRTMNRQEIAPGLYVFVVEAPNYESYVGKFAVIR